MSRRTKSRALALQLLYQLDLNPDVPAEAIREQIDDRLKERDLREFAWRLFVGTREARDEVDAKIEAIADNWRMARMAVTDRNLLRMGAYEILYTETPFAVVIDEAIDLAKKYGSENSSQFVNGLLDRLTPASMKSRTPNEENPSGETMS